MNNFFKKYYGFFKKFLNAVGALNIHAYKILYINKQLKLKLYLNNFNDISSFFIIFCTLDLYLYNKITDLIDLYRYNKITDVSELCNIDYILNLYHYNQIINVSSLG